MTIFQCPTCGSDFTNVFEKCPEDGSILQPRPQSKDEAPRDLFIGQTLGEKYRLDGRIGEGGMGTVYRATDLSMGGRPLAIKILKPGVRTNLKAQERFRREARTAAKIQHAHAVEVTDFDRTPDGLMYIAMELLEGRSLREMLAREAPLDTARAVSLMLQIASAVYAAHEAGIIHRDLKPGNIYLAQHAHSPTIVKVLDFGIAKLASDSADGSDPAAITWPGVVIGTPRYTSPEQCRGDELTPASDVYSLGVILYEMLTGTTPFAGESATAIAVKHTSERPRPPREFVSTVPTTLEDLVLRCLEKRPEDRPADAGELRRELFAIAHDLGLEHASGITAPTIESLMNAGTPSPSGRLVIDIEKLRESLAARARNPEVNGANSEGDDGIAQRSETTVDDG